MSKESGLSIIKDILLAIAIVMSLGALISVIMFYTMKDAQGAELKMFPDYPIAWIGTEYDFGNERVTCKEDGLGWNGSVGIRQSFLDYGPLRMNGVLQHHSCAFSSDNTDYNAVGINFEFHFSKILK